MKYWYIIAIYYLIINIWSFTAMFYDKNKSKQGTDGRGRVKEKSLIIYAFIGGAIGSLLGMYKLRHKTTHFSFKISFWTALVLHISLIAILIYRSII